MTGHPGREGTTMHTTIPPTAHPPAQSPAPRVAAAARHKHAAHQAHHAKFKFATAHRTGPVSAEEKHEELTEQTAKWVSQTFFGQMLKQMRDSPFKSKLFDGGRGGEAFQQMADQHLADSMARGTGHKLVDGIVARIEHVHAAPKAVRGKVTAVAAQRDWGHA